MVDRLLTPDEIIQLGQAHRYLRQWERARDFVFALFGSKAHEATLGTTSIYNDFRYNDELFIFVLDSQGRRLSFDCNLPWWKQFPIHPVTLQQAIAQPTNAQDQDRAVINYNEDTFSFPEDVDFDDASELINQAIHLFFEETIEVTLVNNGAAHNGPSYTFFFDQPPVLPFQEVYALL